MEGELYNVQEGLEGELGFKGERGYSAYEIAVLHGYEGTEQDWIDHFGLDLSGYVQTSDVIDNLTSEYTTHPLSAKQGKVLKDSMDSDVSNINTTLSTKANSSDVYTKTESDTLIATKLSIDSIYILSGQKTISSSSGTSINYNYPTGFNKSNTLVISRMSSFIIPYTEGVQAVNMQIGQVLGTSTTYTHMYDSWDYENPSVILYDDGISINLQNPSDTSLTIHYKIALMKFDE